MTKLTQDQLKEKLSYDTETGLFRWRVTTGGQVAGSVAGADNEGYTMVIVDGQAYAAHRLAWLYVHGVWPVAHIDHVNRVKADNRITNLRDVSVAENSWNKVAPQSNSTTGLRGVYRRVMPNGAVRYRAKIKASGREYFLGLFPTPEEAYAAYCAAKEQLHQIVGYAPTAVPK